MSSRLKFEDRLKGGWVAANQRERRGHGDGTFWRYDYDALGQVISGKKYWHDWTPVAGQQFEYGFDDAFDLHSTRHRGCFAESPAA